MVRVRFILVDYSRTLPFDWRKFVLASYTVIRSGESFAILSWEWLCCVGHFSMFLNGLSEGSKLTRKTLSEAWWMLDRRFERHRRTRSLVYFLLNREPFLLWMLQSWLNHPTYHRTIVVRGMIGVLVWYGDRTKLERLTPSGTQ